MHLKTPTFSFKSYVLSVTEHALCVRTTLYSSCHDDEIIGNSPNVLLLAGETHLLLRNTNIGFFFYKHFDRLLTFVPI